MRFSSPPHTIVPAAADKHTNTAVRNLLAYTDDLSDLQHRSGRTRRYGVRSFNYGIRLKNDFVVAPFPVAS